MPTGQANRLMPTLRRVVLARQSAARSDGELLGAFVATRDADAFAELVRRHGPMVLGVCRRVVGDRAAADDAFQASFLVLARRAAAVRPREQVGNYLYGVAYRTALKARMVLARRRSREKQVDVMPEPTAPAAAPAWTDLQPVIDEELAKLPDKLRVPVVLCDLEGRPQREVAKHLNVPPATLATRLASARRTLAQRLTRRGVTLSGGALATLLGTHAAVSAVPPALTAGLARAAEVAATGGALDSLVSANAVQLSEGVMRMMMLAKLKAVAVMAVTALALTTGLGLGLVPATAGDDPSPGSGPTTTAKLAPAAPHESVARAAKPQERAAPQPAPEPDDATFLRRLCLDVRGTLPTPVEMWFFISDEDADKRAKVVDWMIDEDEAKAALAKKLGVPVERVRVVRVRLAPDGKHLVAVAAGQDAPRHTLSYTLTADGKKWTVLADGAARDGVALSRTVDKTIEGKFATWIDVDAGPDAAKAADARRVYLWRKVVAAHEKTGKLIDVPVESFHGIARLAADDKNPPDAVWADELFAYVDASASMDSDAQFLKRVLTDVRGNGPTALELKYFTEDKDPKKREKLIDTLLKDPAVQKKLGDAWKTKMLAPQAATFNRNILRGNDLFLYVAPTDGKPADLLLHRGELFTKPLPQPPQPPKPPQPPVPPKPPAPQVDRFEKLVGELLAAKKTDAEVLEAVTLAAMSRLPTDSEKKLTLAVVATATDRKAAWVAVAKALAGEPKKPEVRGFELKVPPPVPTPPTPPTPPKP